MRALRPRVALLGAAVAGVAAALVAALWLWQIRPAVRLAALKQEYRPPAAIPFPADNPFSAAKADLGRALFFDPRLSRSGTLACAGCHQAPLGWSDGRSLAVGDAGSAMGRRSPSLIDIAWVPVLGWDGKFPDLESVVFGAITGAFNMNLTVPETLARIQADPAYRAAFARAFPDGAVTQRNVAAAIATFERLIVSAPDSPFDRWIAGDDSAISESAKRGFLLFNGRANCSACHSGWTFTDGSFHDLGTATPGEAGRGQFFPTSEALRGAFKTPTLRGIAKRGPFMHNGSVPTLAAVIDLYNRGGLLRPSTDPLIRPLHLSAQERQDLLAFLETLSGDISTSDDPPIPPEKAPPEAADAGLEMRQRGAEQHQAAK